jgi:hypothetical protein
MRANYALLASCETPEDKNAKIWRYMDFAKFASLLEKRALFFSRSDKLGDPFEGSYPQCSINLRPSLYPMPQEGLQMVSVAYKEVRRFFIINCWNLGECESAALWSQYIKSDKGVAIQSTVDRLKWCFITPFDVPFEWLSIGKVKYIDYTKESIPEGYLQNPFLHKRKSFEYENELRAFIMKFPPNLTNMSHLETEKDVFNNGEYVEVNLDRLIENVYVCPTAQPWFRDLVKSVMTKYGLEKKSIPSDLDAQPVY